MDKVKKLKVKDVMIDFKTVNPSTPIDELIEVFEDEKTDAVAVVNEKKKFIGEVHQRDLLKLLIDPHDISWQEVVGPFGKIIDMGYFALTAEDLMKTHEITVSTEDKIEDIVKMMLRHGLEVVPVVEKDKLLGMVTELEILEQVFKHKKHLKRGKKK